jgi:RHS repeat-associated protein
LTGTDGNIVERYNYDAYGALLNFVGTPKTNWQFGGDGLWDPNSLFTYHLARFRDGGRFISYDSFEADASSPADLHRYLYTSVNPVSAWDPTGLWWYGFFALDDPAHQYIVGAAATEAGYTVGADSFFLKGLRRGSMYPDNPDAKDPESWEGYRILLQVERGAAPPLTMRSHTGDLQYWHAMAVPGKTPQEMQTLIVDWIVCQYICARMLKQNLAASAAGFELGKALHTLADSYAPPHTSRAVTTMPDGTLVFGAITRFQDYTVQDGDLHRHDDHPGADAYTTAAAANAAFQCAELLKRFRANAEPSAVRAWLLAGPMSLAPNAVSGGTDPKYAKRPPAPPMRIDQILVPELGSPLGGF